MESVLWLILFIVFGIIGIAIRSPFPPTRNESESSSLEEVGRNSQPHHHPSHRPPLPPTGKVSDSTSRKSAQNTPVVNNVLLQPHSSSSKQLISPLAITAEVRGSSVTSTPPPSSSSVGSKKSEKSSKSLDQGWTALEKVALYALHSKTDLSTPNFWQVISQKLQERGFDRSAKECEDQWYKVNVF